MERVNFHIPYSHNIPSFLREYEIYLFNFFHIFFSFVFSCQHFCWTKKKKSDTDSWKFIVHYLHHTHTAYAIRHAIERIFISFMVTVSSYICVYSSMRSMMPLWKLMHGFCMHQFASLLVHIFVCQKYFVYTLHGNIVYTWLFTIVLRNTCCQLRCKPNAAPISAHDVNVTSFFFFVYGNAPPIQIVQLKLKRTTVAATSQHHRFSFSMTSGAYISIWVRLKALKNDMQ